MSYISIYANKNPYICAFSYVKDDMREVFDAAVKRIPDLVKIFVEIRKTEDKYDKLLRCVSPHHDILRLVSLMLIIKMAVHYRKARSDDTNSLGDKAGAYIPRVYGELGQERLLGGQHTHSYEREVTARMLCPREKLDSFNQDPM